MGDKRDGPKTPPGYRSHLLPYVMSPDEQRIFEALKDHFPLTMQEVVAIAETASHHWELLYRDGHWSLLVGSNAVAVSVGRGGLTYLGSQLDVETILSLFAVEGH